MALVAPGLPVASVFEGCGFFRSGVFLRQKGAGVVSVKGANASFPLFLKQDALFFLGSNLSFPNGLS